MVHDALVRYDSESNTFQARYAKCLHILPTLYYFIFIALITQNYIELDDNISFDD